MYNDKVSKSLGEAKALKWGQMKKKSTSRIPPDMDSFQLYVARVNYQTYLHLGFDKPDAPSSPTVRYTKEALPRSLDAVLHQERHEIPPDLSDTREVSDTGEEIDYDSELSDTKELD